MVSNETTNTFFLQLHWRSFEMNKMIFSLKFYHFFIIFSLRASAKRKKNGFFEIDLSKSIWPSSNRFEPCFPLQNYRFSAQIDSNRWSVRKRTIDRYNCRIRNITIPVIDLSRFFGKSLRVWVVERARIFTQWRV